ncbi:MAG: LPS-assembly protein LptD [Candidatus Omnitrophota bacterium]
MKTKKTFALIIKIAIIACLWNQGFFLFSETSLPFTIYSKEKEFAEDRMIASGDVEIIFEEYKIYADHLEYFPKTKDINAQGRVTMSSEETVISGDKLHFNLKTKTGEMVDTYGQMQPSVRYKTDKLTQVDNETLTFDHFDFTTCAQCTPRWKITCSKGKLKKEKYIEMKNILFKVKKVPFFYVPYLRYPLDQNGKSTGFLFPRLGSSSLRGFFMLNSFFWDIKPNVDLTLNLDYYGKAGIGGSEEFRYLFPNMEGNVKFYYFKYNPGVVIPKTAPVPVGQFYSHNKSDYYLKMYHKQRLNFLNTRITADIDKQSDANFLRLFSNNFDMISTRTARSSVTVNSSYANMKFALSASQNDTYYTWINESRTIRYLPQISFNVNQQKLWKIPGYFSLDTSYSNIMREGKSYEEDETVFVTNTKSKRFSFNPSYSLRLIDAPWLSTKFSLISRNSFYPKSMDPVTKKEVDKPLHLSYGTSILDFKGPSFSKIFESGSTKLKHLIMPGITIQYATKVAPEDRARLMPVDSFDYPDYSYVSFYLTTRLLSKGPKDKSASEILSYTIAQDYYFDPYEANRGRKVNGKYPEFSDLKNTLRLRLFKYFNLDATFNYNYFVNKDLGFWKRFSRLNVRFSYTDKKNFLYGSVFYSSYMNIYDTTANYYLNRDVVGGNLVFDLPGFPVKFNSDVYYDITQKVFRNASLKLSYDYQCIVFNTELKIFKYTNRIESRFEFGISFGNLGTVKDMLGAD